MMKRFVLLTILSAALLSANANHITGGEIFYTFVSQSGNNYTYRVTLKLFRDHFSSGAPLDASAPIAIFDRVTGAMIWNNSIPKTSQQELQLTSPGPCINNPPIVDYDVGFYTFNVTLPGNVNGYIVSYQRCCRIVGISNIGGTSSNVGATYTAEIPGTNPLATAPVNNSAHFLGIDTVIICRFSQFFYNFGALDPDGDSLSYSFCNAYTGGGPTTGTSCSDATPTPPCPPPYGSIPYALPDFSPTSPMGPAVTINPTTGLVSGIAPEAGIYVMTVCVNEYRNGVLIATQRKDLQIKVGACSVAAVSLNPSYITCDGYSLTFFNQGDQSLINSYFWTFGDPASGPNDSSTLATPTHTFADTGTYTVTLITNRFGACSDTGTTIAKVYPGFFPGFVFSGICANHPTQFTDTTKTNYGVVNSWTWNFGNTSTLSDTSHLQNPVYTYPTPGTYNVQFIVSNSKGCVDTISKPVDILDKPPLALAFRDTIICIGDQVQLHAIGNGLFTWTPLVSITNANTPDPTVNPPNTTMYHVNLNDQGCLNDDSVRVRVISQVTLNAFSDSTICQGDTAFLHATGDGLRYQWTPSASLNNPNSANPIAVVNNTTTYQVTSFVGSCSTTKSVTITTVPYPVANAGPDTTICFNTFAQLNGSMTGSQFTWSPSGSLSNPQSLSPIATPPRTTSYILTVRDNLGCPKPGRDTVVVTVQPKVQAFAGHDTSVVVGQPLHFNATGGVSYLWSPATSLNNPAIANPTAVYNGSFNTITYRVLVTSALGCVDSAFITVKIFEVNPQIFVPTAFTPNGDGLNDVVRPIGVGIKKFEYFRIYNRWGQLVFSTSTNEDGWDGKIGGQEQGTAVFVWIVSGIDYLDRRFFKKGTVTLIR